MGQLAFLKMYLLVSIPTDINDHIDTIERINFLLAI